jgi:hypothetical protein
MLTHPNKEGNMHKCQLCGRRYTESEAATKLEVTRRLRPLLDHCFTITHCLDCDLSDFPLSVRDLDPTKNKEQTDE